MTVHDFSFGGVKYTFSEHLTLLMREKVRYLNLVTYQTTYFLSLLSSHNTTVRMATTNIDAFV